jgi:hypothetical protein
MELLVNSIAGLVLLMVDVVRGLFQSSDDALLAAAAVAAGAYVGTQIALTRYDRVVRSRAVPGR